jgi:hypothetical protein
VRVRESRPGAVLVRRGRWPCSPPEEAAADAVRHLPLDDGVVLVDRLAHSGITTLAAVRNAAARLPSCRGSARARTAVSLADGRAESPQETRLRLLLLRAGLPAPVAQHRVFDDVGFVARVDFAYVDLKIAIEYDGLWHGERTAFLADRRRLNRLTAAGWVVVHVTAEDIGSPERLAACIAAARARRIEQSTTR